MTLAGDADGLLPERVGETSREPTISDRPDRNAYHLARVLECKEQKTLRLDEQAFAHLLECFVLGPGACAPAPIMVGGFGHGFVAAPPRFRLRAGG